MLYLMETSGLAELQVHAVAGASIREYTALSTCNVETA
jgi:hypothetical protein